MSSSNAPARAERHVLALPRRFTKAGDDPFASVEWERRTAVIAGADGAPVFVQADVEVPKAWSQLATNVVASKYFHGALGTPERESSVRQLIGRVVRTMTDWARDAQLFHAPDDVSAFADELTYVLLHQMAAFNSPVWFNVGVQPQPQCSACFIVSVQDSLGSILELAATEARLFKYGSGTGSNLSTLRAEGEPLSGGGSASGPVSFMRGFDAFAGVIKSGGKTRRAAKMVILDVDHPDILDFVNAKADEERKAWALIDAGYDGSIDGEAYGSVFFQNSNNSVRVSDAFMEAVRDGGPWETKRRTDGSTAATHDARDIFRQIVEAAHLCGDPGLQFDDAIQHWHTCKSTDRIYASNPCSEFMFLNDTACNLASINLMKFWSDKGIDTEALLHVVRLVFTAQELIVGNASYPTAAIAERSKQFRPLGLGYANLGALIMAHGYAYDSDEGRALASAITALICGEAYAQSARLAAELGPFDGYNANAEAMRSVIANHLAAVDERPHGKALGSLVDAAREAWQRAHDLGAAYGYRNAQATVIAPTGTIGFMMDCDTTGVEPDIALVKYKKLVGGGLVKYVNNTVPHALRALGYDANAIADITAYIAEQGTIEGAPQLDPKHLPVFDCAFPASADGRSIAWSGHINMMAAVQPFVSGAISKTVNLPATATTDDVADAYQTAWRLGLKAVAIYRDGSKRAQPLATKAQTIKTDTPPQRTRLPDERRAITHKFSIAGHEGYVTVGLYDDGRPGELFITMSKEGSTISGLMDALATSVSIALQYGVPLSVLADKFAHTRYEPSGFTGNREIPIAKSITDYIFRWLTLKFSGEAQPPRLALPTQPRVTTVDPLASLQADAPVCAECGSIMVRNASCYRCLNCGTTNGCS
jgi:ribonucleoside-diphosphate reductase alpha chain